MYIELNKTEKSNLIETLRAIELSQLAQKKINAWEKNFVSNIRCKLEHEDLNQVSFKQQSCLGRIFVKLKFKEDI